MAVAQPFAMCAIFLACAVACLVKRARVSGLGVVAAGLLVMAAGEPFLGLARLRPEYMELGNYVQGTTLPVGALVLLAGLAVVRPA